MSRIGVQAQELNNLGFEEPSDTAARGWVFPTGVEFALDKTLPAEGFQSICLSGNFSKKWTNYFYQTVPVQLKKAARYRVSALIRHEKIDSGFAGIFAYTKQGENFVSYSNMHATPLQGTAEWKNYSIEVVADPTVESLTIGGQLAANGKVWFDQFWVEPLPAAGKMTKASRRYLSEFLKLIDKNALYRDSVDFKSIKKNAFSLAKGAKTTGDCYESFRYVIQKLNDRHSFFWTPDQAKAWKSGAAAGEEEPAPLIYSHGRVIDGRFGYISMPMFLKGDSISIQAFADSLQGLIRSLDSETIEGWVLDLRENHGGNCWPMLAGIGPVLGEGVAGYFVDTRNRASWYYKAGGSYSNETRITQVSRAPYQLKRPNPKVAVLTGPGTTSSGEVVAVSFRGRPNTRSFGEATGGYSTGNQNYTLSDGAMLFLASSVYADRKMNLYGKKINPDEEIISTSTTLAGDETLTRALAWLRKTE